MVSKVVSYWGRAVAWSFGSLAAMGLAWGMSADPKTDYYLRIVLWVVFVTVLIITFRQWKKIFSGQNFIQHECKICGNKWRDGYTR